MARTKKVLLRSGNDDGDVSVLPKEVSSKEALSAALSLAEQRAAETAEATASGLAMWDAVGKLWRTIPVELRGLLVKPRCAAVCTLREGMFCVVRAAQAVRRLLQVRFLGDENRAFAAGVGTFLGAMSTMVPHKGDSVRTVGMPFDDDVFEPLPQWLWTEDAQSDEEEEEDDEDDDYGVNAPAVMHLVEHIRSVSKVVGDFRRHRLEKQTLADESLRVCIGSVVQVADRGGEGGEGGGGIGSVVQVADRGGEGGEGGGGIGSVVQVADRGIVVPTKRIVVPTKRKAAC